MFNTFRLLDTWLQIGAIALVAMGGMSIGVYFQDNEVGTITLIVGFLCVVFGIIMNPSIKVYRISQHIMLRGKVVDLRIISENQNYSVDVGSTEQFLTFTLDTSTPPSVGQEVEVVFDPGTAYFNKVKLIQLVPVYSPGNGAKPETDESPGESSA